MLEAEELPASLSKEGLGVSYSGLGLRVYGYIGVILGNLGIMDNKMETIISYRVSGLVPGEPCILSKKECILRWL